MDKELLRVIIILVGVLVMVGMLLWHFFKSLHGRSDNDYPDAMPYDDGDDADDGIDDDAFYDAFADGSEEGDGALDDELIKPQPKQAASTVVEPVKPASRDHLPALIEFSIVARDDQGFNGQTLFDAFEEQGLRYGSVMVFERIDANRLVDFTVASMQSPGTFPATGLDDYFAPGIIFFMQPRIVDQPAAVFDDFMRTIDRLAEQLDGVAWDHQKQPLTADTVNHFRQLLAQS